eukprot:gene14454-30762_t
MSLGKQLLYDFINIFTTIKHNRQELVRRDAFDFKDEDNVNYRSMLERLIKELVKDREREIEIKDLALEQERTVARDLAKQQREAKKREAIEKSRARQADPEYFKKITAANIEPVKEEVSINENNPSELDDDENNSRASSDCSDPFRIDKKRRNK